jgi:vancomycin permeability regulator SanA
MPLPTERGHLKPAQRCREESLVGLAGPVFSETRQHWCARRAGFRCPRSMSVAFLIYGFCFSKTISLYLERVLFSLMKFLNSKVRKVLAILLVFPLWFLAHTFYIVVDGLNDEIARADVAVVLGNTVERDGRPSERLKARLDKAVELYEKQLVAQIIVSGGFGAEGFEEADVMRDYLVGKNIPESNIILDKDGYNTYKTAVNTRQIMQANNMQSVIIVSQYFHITRTRLAFQNAGITTVYAAHADYFELRDVYSVFREFTGFYSYLLGEKYRN